MVRINEVAAKLGIPEQHLEPYGHYKAKVGLDYIETLKDRPDGHLILVTAISPTPAGEGKTTTALNLALALAECGRAKVLLGVGRGRRVYDKREAIKRREMEREADRAVRVRR